MIELKKCKGSKIINCLLLSIALLAAGCNKSSKQIIVMSETTKTDTIKETYVELGFFGPVKQDKWLNLVQAVQNNIAHSRKEPGNLSFNLYIPENDTLQPIWFERFRTKEAHNFHMQQDYFKNAIEVIQKSLMGEALSIALKDVKEIPVVIPENTNALFSHNNIILYSVKPAYRQQFIATIADATIKCRALTGNIEYNLYQYKDEPDKFVLIEGWKDIAYKGQLHEPKAEYFVTDPILWVVKDISE